MVKTTNQVSYGKKTLREMPVSKTSHMVERMSLLGYFVYFVFLQNFEVIPRSSFYEETTCSAEIPQKLTCWTME